MRHATTVLLGLFSTVLLSSSALNIGIPATQSDLIQFQGQYAIKDEVIVAMASDRSHVSVQRLLVEYSARWGVSDLVVGGEVLLTSVESRADQPSYRHVVRLSLAPGRALSDAIAILEAGRNVLWVQPNYVYNVDRDPRELVPNDARYKEQYHHPLMKDEAAWDDTLGEGPLVAITDDGFDIKHGDLKDTVYKNPHEIPGNGIDDDQNGLIDDVNGYDFCHKNNDPSNNTSGDQHGTHVAGIAVGRGDNEVGIAGVASGGQFLPIQFYGNCSWTSTLVLTSYKYAADQGAKILSTSYNIDDMSEDKIFLEGVNYAFNKGVLLFNSAGNNNSDQPKRFKLNQVMMVASSTAKDEKSSFSNYGIGVDISAPGSDILSSIPDGGWAKFSGTSMATPAAAGVAALIWSRFPEYTREQVAAKLYATADNIDAVNPKYIDKLGGGRVNAARAVSNEEIPAPRVKVIVGLPNVGTPISGKALKLKVRFNQLMDSESINRDDSILLERIDGKVTEQVQLIRSGSWAMASNELEIAADDLAPGEYRFTISGHVQNPFGIQLNGKGTGVNSGTDFVQTFTVTP